MLNSEAGIKITCFADKKVKKNIQAVREGKETFPFFVASHLKPAPAPNACPWMEPAGQGAPSPPTTGRAELPQPLAAVFAFCQAGHLPPLFLQGYWNSSSAC